MMSKEHVDLDGFIKGVERRNPGQPEFVQAVHEAAHDIFDFIQGKPVYHEYQILRRIAEPDRVISFRVCWEDDKNNIRVQRGWRVQNNNSIGPYKGGIRFHPSVTESVRDIGVGGREIGYMFGQYKRITNEFTGVLTGKGLEYGGSLIRTEATGYGAVYFLQNMLEANKNSVAGKTAVISGSGNVATHAAEKIVQLGGKVLTLSDSEGFIHDPDGITQEKIDWVKVLKTKRRGRMSEYVKEFKGASFTGGGARPWGVKCDVALPCATQNELNGADAETLVKNGCIAVSEGANMPTDLAGIAAFKKSRILYAPGKAANAGGVAVSGLEMAQNSGRRSWKAEELQQLLKDIMQGIHSRCLEYGKEKDGHVDYVRGANIAGFKKVADAMLAYGVV
ncbi:MAG: glutamate dehydrogenase [Alphaproteobacteria bacterium]|nr:glutamate dehydrogenase [Alphaproteobacteria bacterium]